LSTKNNKPNNIDSAHTTQRIKPTASAGAADSDTGKGQDVDSTHASSRYRSRTPDAINEGNKSDHDNHRDLTTKAVGRKEIGVCYTRTPPN